MPPEPQLALPLAPAARDYNATDVQWFIGYLAHHEWIFAGEILRQIGQPETEDAKRWLRGLAERSGGKIVGGQKGYTLMSKLTAEEFHAVRATFESVVRKHQARLIEMDREFYGRPALSLHAGVLSPNVKLTP